ncbi:MAG: flagellar biosynthetic protein FliO [Spirochaetaceae bacterium]|nr:flagellar biosynthetic protein FliO [Spirochaetaceae bacterium]
MSFYAQSTSSDVVSETSQSVSSSKEHESQMIISTNQEVVEQRSTNTAWLFVRMILVLLVVIGCIYAVFYFVKKTTNPTNETDAFLKKVASITLSPGKSVQVVTLLNHCYILGVSDSSVQLISELDDKDLIDAMNLEADKESSGSVKDFASLLASAMGLKKKTFEESVSSSVENMQTQSNRLKNISLSEKKDEE